MQINKQGMLYSNMFYESNAMDIVGDSSIKSYTPSTGTNSCISGYVATYNSDYLIYHITVTVTWSGFDESNTSGTFNLRWQGSNYPLSGSAVWQGTNYAATALNSAASLKTIVLGSTSGVYIYDTSFTIPSSWFETYKGSNIGIRSDYSNGTGNISISNIKIVPMKYYAENRAIVGEGYLASHEFYEI